MHPLEQNYLGGMDSALSSFGMLKEALSPEQKAQMLAAYKARPKGLAAMAPKPAVNVPTASMAGATGAAPAVGGPGMAAGFGGRGLDLATPTLEAEKNRAMRGGSLYGQPLPASKGPVALHPGMNVVGHLLLPWPE